MAALGDDVGGAEVAAEAGAVGVPAHQDDLSGAEPARGQHREQADRAIADHGHGVTAGAAWAAMNKAATSPGTAQAGTGPA